MADSYDTHKGLVDASNPTPGIVWHQLEDQEGGGYHRVARFYSEFARTGYTYIAQARESNGLHFEIAQVGPAGVHRLIGINGTEWGTVAAAFQTYWSEVCDQVRRAKAYGNHGRDILQDAGAVVLVSHDASLRGVTAQAGAQILLPRFTTDVLIYTGVTSQPRLVMEVIRGDGKATVRWAFNEERSGGLTATFDLELGDNVITATVTAHDQYTRRVYSFIITKS